MSGGAGSIAAEDASGSELAQSLKQDGNALFKAGKHSEAVTCYERALTACNAGELLVTVLQTPPWGT